MFSALLYLQLHSFKNRLLERLRRLKRPRYLVGALVGTLYFVSILLRPILMSLGQGGTPRQRMPRVLPEVPSEVWEFVAALLLLVLTALVWLIPWERAALVFTEAEIAFLFPAPIRRQTLIHYKLLRSQLAVLFTVMFLTVLTGWVGGMGGGLLRAAGWWMLFSTMNLHLLGASFARTLLLERGITPWRRRALLLAGLALAAAGAAWWARAEVPVLTARDTLSLSTFADYLGAVARSTPAFWLLLPFRVVVRPFLASGNPAAFLSAAGPALGLLALHYLWVARSDVAFEEASIGASQRHAARAAAVRSGNWQNTRPARKRRAPFRLAPTGPPAVAILWKNLLGASQYFNVRLALGVVVWSGIVGTAFGSGGGHTPWPLVVGGMCVIILGLLVVLGPQLVRQDFRRDLAVADLLKIYPMRGWQVALGELLAPAVILTVLQWGLIVLAVTLFSQGHAAAAEALADTEEHASRFWYWRGPLSLGIAAAVVIPAFNMVSLLIPNAAALLLPGWFASAGANGDSVMGQGRGIEVMGQRMVFLLGQLAALALALLPAGVVYLIVYNLAARPFLSAAVATPVSAGAVALVFAAEAAGGLAVLGHWFEKYDLSAEKG